MIYLPRCSFEIHTNIGKMAGAVAGFSRLSWVIEYTKV